MNIRQAKLPGEASRIAVVRSYLPSNFVAFTYGNDIVIEGQDEAGWTMEGYVIPRLNSGLFFPKLTI